VSTGLSRRDFLELSVLFGGALVGCSSSNSAPHPVKHPPLDGGLDSGVAAEAGVEAGADAGTVEVPFGIWEKLRDAVRASPDHLTQVAAGLVQKKDPTAIFEFVRDQIQTCPAANNTIATGQRWGATATLRGGMGTPREKAELLASLYQQAGFTASVMTVFSSSATDVTSTVYTQQVSRTFAPTVDDATLAGWTQQMTVVPGAPLTTTIDPDDSERQAVISAVTALLPASASAILDGVPPVASSLGIGTMPIVAVTVNGKVQYANPLLPTAVFGTSYGENLAAAPAADPLLPVVVELFASSTANPTIRNSIAKASFTADQVVGQQVTVGFLPPVQDPDALAALRISDVHVFRAVVALRSPNTDDATFVKNLVVGSQVTLRGDIVTTATDGTVMLNGQPVIGSGASTDVSNMAKVAKLTVASVNAAAFPTIKVQVTATDSTGAVVTGLPAAAFGVTEQGTPVGFVESGSPMAALSVALIVDVDGPLGNGDDPLSLAKQITTQVAAAGGSVLVIYNGVASAPLTDPAAVLMAFSSVSSALPDDDDCWPDVAAAAATNASLVLFISDFTGFVGADPAPYQTTAYSGPPVIAVGVPTDAGDLTIPPDVPALVAATGGQSLPGAGITDTLAALTAAIAARKKLGAYTLTYTAPVAGPATRTVKVSTADGKSSATGTYTVPAIPSASIPAGLAGIYLAVTVGTRTVKRTLAGYASANPPSSNETITQADLDDVHGAMFGGTVLSFEGAAPTLSAQLDDLLTSKLAARPLWEAVKSADVTAIRAARGVTRYYVPPELALLQCVAPAAAASTLTYQSSLRVIACTEHVQLGTGRVRKLDVLSFPGWLTFAADTKTSFSLTLARSARAAVVEAHALGAGAVTAASLLAGVKLQFLDAVNVFAAELSTIPAAEQQAASEILNEYADFYKFIPAQGSLTAFWAVHASTGMILGVLPDGSGGASSPSACSDLSDASNALDALGLLGDLGPYGALGKAVAAIFAATGIILEGISDPNFTYDPDQLQKDIAGALTCNMTQDAASGALGDVSAVASGASTANTVAGIETGHSLGCSANGLESLGCGG